jgi:hypothetical protein
MREQITRAPDEHSVRPTSDFCSTPGKGFRMSDGSMSSILLLQGHRRWLVLEQGHRDSSGWRAPRGRRCAQPLSSISDDAANVSALVYVAAFASDEGESAASLSEPFGQLPSASHFAIDKQSRFTLPQDLFPQFFCPDVDPVEAGVMAAVQGPSDAARFGFVSGPPAWREHRLLHRRRGPAARSWFRNHRRSPT